MMKLRIGVFVLTGLVLSAGSAHAQDSLVRAKNFYASADYEEALQVLDKLRGGAVDADATEVASYQLFCLVALGRSEEAALAVEGIVRTDPLYHPPTADVAPRVVAFFEEVRRPLLSAVAKQMYARAKEAFDKKDSVTALKEFDRVIALLDEIGPAEGADLRMLAAGFRELSKTAEPPAPAPVVAPVVEAPAPLPVYGAGNSDVQAPVLTSRTLPAWQPGNLVISRQTFKGTLDLVIGEDGRVRSAALSKSIHPSYDTLLLQAVEAWRFKPAMKDGAPVRYRLSMEIVLNP